MTRQLILIALFLLLGAYSEVNAEEMGDALEASGRKQYLKYCASCHGLEARGDGPLSVALKTKPANLRQIAQRRGGKFPVEEIKMIIDGRGNQPAHGTRDMPVWGEQFSEAVGGESVGEEVVRGNLVVLVEYLQAIQEK